MELSKKTTILLSPETHRYLSEVAARKGKSLGELVREACVARGTVWSTQLRAWPPSALSRPVSSPRDVKQESVPSPRDLMPPTRSRAKR